MSINTTFVQVLEGFEQLHDNTYLVLRVDELIGIKHILEG